MISGKDNQIEEVDIHHTLEGVGVGVLDNRYAVADQEEVLDMASTADAEEVGLHKQDNPRVAEKSHVMEEGHANTVEEAGIGMAEDAGT